MEVYCPHRDEEVKINSSCSSSSGDRKVACGRHTSLDDAMLLPPDGVSDALIYSDVRNRMDESHDQKSASSSASSCYHSNTSSQDKISIADSLDKLPSNSFHSNISINSQFSMAESLSKQDNKWDRQSLRNKTNQGDGQTIKKSKTCHKMATPEVWNPDLSVIAHAQTDSIFQTSSDDFTFSTLEDATGSLTAILDRSIDSECLTWDTQCCQDTQVESLNDWLQRTPTRGRSVESLASSLEGDSPGVSTRPVQGSPAEIPPSSFLVSNTNMFVDEDLKTHSWRHNSYFYSYSAGIDFSHQKLISVDVRFWRV